MLHRINSCGVLTQLSAPDAAVWTGLKSSIAPNGKSFAVIFLTPQKLKSYQNLVTLLKCKPMGRNTSISLGNHFEEFVDNKVSTGRFKNASEVIRAGLRLLEEEETKILTLKNAITTGIESGVANNFDPKNHLEKLKAAKRKNG